MGRRKRRTQQEVAALKRNAVKAKQEKREFKAVRHLMAETKRMASMGNGLF